jgi:hypothetical protein
MAMHAAYCGRMGRSDFIGPPNVSLAGREWPDGPNKKWLEGLQRPDNEQNPYRKLDPNSLSGCGAGDTVQTQFKVEMPAASIPKTLGMRG